MKWPVSVSVHAKDFSEARMAEFEASEIRYMELTASSVEEIGAVLDRLSDLKKAAEKHRPGRSGGFQAGKFCPNTDEDPAGSGGCRDRHCRGSSQR